MMKLQHRLNWETASYTLLAVLVAGAVVKTTHGFYGLMPRWTYAWDFGQELGMVACAVLFVAGAFLAGLGAYRMLKPEADVDGPGLGGTVFYGLFAAFMAYVLLEPLV